MLLGTSGLPYTLGRVDPVLRVSAVYPPQPWDQVLAAGGAPLMRVIRMRSGVDQDEWGVESGSVQIRAGASPRRSFTGALVPPPGTSLAAARDALDPWAGTELRIEVGATHPRTGSVRWWSAAVVIPDEIEVSDDGAVLSVGVAGPDRSTTIRGLKLLAGLTVPAGEASAVIAQILAGRLPAWVTPAIDPTGLTTSATYIAGVGMDPWKLAEDIAASAGCEVLIDRSGRPTIRRLTAVAAESPAAQWITSQGAWLTSLRDSLSWSAGADGVIVPWGDGAAEIVPDGARQRYVMWEGDSSLIASQSQAIRAGEAELARLGRGVRSVSGVVVTHPELDVDDVVAIDHAPTGTRVVARLTQLTLTAGSPLMSWTAADTTWTPEAA